MRSFEACLDRVVLTLRLLSKTAVLGLMACSSGLDPDLCEGSDCEPEQWMTNPEITADARVQILSQMDDSIEKIRLISKQVDHSPDQAAAYCGLLPRGMSRERCLHIRDRTHLWVSLGETTEVGARAGPGPTHSVLRTVDVPFSDWIHVRAKPGSFRGEVDVHGQVWATAMNAVFRGEVSEVGPACAAVPSGPQWRYDCFFSAAEAHVARWGRAHIKDTLSMCGAAGSFRGLCVTSVIRELAQQSPPSGVGDPVSWAPILMSAHDLRDATETWGVQEDILDRFWSETVLHSVSIAAGVSGDLIEALPAAAAPHVRAAVAYRVLSGSSSPLSLSGAVDVVAAHLGRHLGNQEALREDPPTVVVSDLWPVDRKGESHLSAISYLGQSRRTVADDPETDLRIVVIEAAARLEPPWLEVISAGKMDSDQRVRWTAARLEERLGAQALHVEQPPRLPGSDAPTSSL